MEYVGFWKRFGAHLIDAFFIYLLLSATLLALGVSLSALIPKAHAQAAASDYYDYDAGVDATGARHTYAVPNPKHLRVTPDMIESYPVYMGPNNPPAIGYRIKENPAPVAAATVEPSAASALAPTNPLPEEQKKKAMLARMAAGSLLVSVAYAIFSLIYHTAFVASPWQATPGKEIVGAIVTDKSGNRIGVLRALARHIACGINAFTLNLTYLFVAFTSEKTGLHDMICGTRVIRAD